MKNRDQKNRFLRLLLPMGLLVASAGCSDYLNREPLSDYASTGFYKTEGALKQGAAGCYNYLYMDYTNPSSSNLPLMALWDMYTPYGIERADNNSIGVGNMNLTVNGTIEFQWATFYSAVARCNTVIEGAEPYKADFNDNAKAILAEIKTLRGYFYLQMISLWGDIPFFTKTVTEEEARNCKVTPVYEIVDYLLTDLEEASAAMPWSQKEWGRIDKSVALGLKARLALYAGSWAKFGYGMRGTTDANRATQYLTAAADAADRIMKFSGRDLNSNYDALFTRVGQESAGAKKEIMLPMMMSDQGAKRTSYWSVGEQCRMIGQSGRFPTQLLVDTYETKGGKRIDEDASYNPKKPFENRDPRLRATIYCQGDTIIGNTGTAKKKFLMEIYNPKTKSFDEQGNETLVDNLDYSGSVAPYGYVQSGVGFAWKKYNHFDDESTFYPTYNFSLMRFAEILLIYAEAKIELNQIDATVYSAIDRVRSRVNMPAILTVDPTRANNQVKMRQIVRRERKVELAKETLMLFDMRRWRVAPLLNEQPTYGYPVVTVSGGNYPNGYSLATADMVPKYGAVGSDRDINDVAEYSAYAQKLRKRDVGRSWNDAFYVWPIPQTERNKAPWLEQKEGYSK